MASTLSGRSGIAPGVRPPVVRARFRAFALPEVYWAATATVLFLIGAGTHVAGGPDWLWWGLYLACSLTGGWEPALAGLRALRAKTLDVDLLMVLAAAGAAAIGQVFDGALLIVIFATSGALDAVATRRTADSVRALLDLTPERATRLLPGGREETVDTAALTVDDVILVRPGERIGADGDVLDGASEVDQASITGEPLPVPVATGTEVFAGTGNGTGVLRVRVRRAASDSVIARIGALVEEASATKARTQLFVEKIEQRYSVGVVLATLTLFFGPLAFGAALEPTLLRAMTFMIVASPCAVVLATMPPLLSAIANAGRHGVLVKSAVVMEQLGTTTRVAFDKTGTLTQAAPHVVALVALEGAGVPGDRLLALAAGAEHPSEHPLGRAIVAAAARAGVDLPPAREFSSSPGRGVRALVNGHRIEVGGPRHLLPTAASDRPRTGPATRADPARADLAARACAVVDELEAAGRTAVLVLVDGTPAGVLGLADQLRPAAARTVARVAAMTGQPPVVLTGDNPRAAARLGAVLGTPDVRAGLLPQDKVAAVGELAAGGERVLVVGDGVNDAPALAAAHVGVAMGGAGADLTLDTADAVVVRDELAAIPTVIALARRARRLVIANLALAGSVIAVLVTWDLVGHLPLPLGVAGHEGSTVLVGLNGLRLLRDTAWRKATCG